MSSSAWASSSKGTTAPTVGWMDPAASSSSRWFWTARPTSVVGGLNRGTGTGTCSVAYGAAAGLDVGENHADQIEISKTHGPTGDQRNLLGLDAAGEPDAQMTATATQAPERLHHGLAAYPVETDVDA